LWIVALAVTPSFAAAQVGPRPMPDSVQAGRLRAEIERRFAERVRTDLGLTDDQALKLKATQERFGVRRRELMRQQWLHRQALQRQMQPGVAAQPDSVRVHMDGLQAGRGEMFKLEQDEDREMAGYLTPVQRARFQFMRQRLMERANELRRGREERGRMGPGPQGGMQRPRGRRPR
jgi:hypothetical protein